MTGYGEMGFRLRGCFGVLLTEIFRWIGLICSLI